MTEALTQTAELTPEAAQAQLTALKGNKEWGARVLAGDAAANAESDRLHRAAYAEPAAATSEAQAAQQQLDTLKNDPAWRRRVADGDLEANKQHEDLIKAANPEGAAEAIDPSQYRVPSLATVDDTAEEFAAAQEREQQVRGWLATAQIPIDIGNWILSEAEQTSNMWRTASDTERQAYSDKQEGMLRRMWGGQYTAKLQLAGQLLRELEGRSPGIIEMMTVTGAGNNASVINSMALAAEALLAKKGKPHG